ncbi:MAG: acyltransferase [Rikenellaceae bacterium]|nr:acyltransferase [Rikenellaceae bacterium]
MKDLKIEKIRGICIIAVILIYSMPYISIEGQFTESLLPFRQIINFPVAFFIFLSGYFVKYNEKDLGFSWIKKRSVRLLTPYLIWTTIYIVYNIVAQPIPTPPSAKQIIASFLLGRSAPQMYFLLILFQLILITPILRNSFTNPDKKIKRIFFLLLTPVYLILLYCYNYTVGKQLPLYSLWFPAWFGFYYLGGLIRSGSSGYVKLSRNLSNIFLFCIIGLVIAIFESTAIVNLTGMWSWASSQIKISSFIYTFFFIILMFNLKKYDKKPSENSLMVKIGNYSFGIYLCHMVFLPLIMTFLGIFSFLDSLLLVKMVLGAAITVFLSYVFAAGSSRILGNRMAVILGMK